jgi:predicted MFS family arabinose efflux permease
MTVLKASALPRDRAPASTDRGQTAWRAIAFLTVILFAGAVMRTIFGPLQEAAKLDLKLSDFDISLVQGLGAGAPVAIVAVPLAWVIDHGNRVRLVIVMMAICVIGTLWTAFAGGLTTLFLARVLSALGAGCTTSAIISLVADIAAPDRRGRSIVVLAMGAYVGSAAAFVRRPDAQRPGGPPHRVLGGHGALARDPSASGTCRHAFALSAVFPSRADTA